MMLLRDDCNVGARNDAIPFILKGVQAKSAPENFH